MEDYHSIYTGAEVDARLGQAGRSVFFCTCATAAATAAKVITIDSGQPEFRLEKGVVISVLFAETNSASNPTFAVGGNTAKSVWYNTAAISTANLAMAGTLNVPMQYVYDGTYWRWIGWGKDNNTTYSSMSESEMKTGTATSARSVTAERLRKGCNGYVTAVSGTSITQELQAGIFYSFGVLTALTVTLQTPVSGMVNEYKFEFTSGNTAATLSIPASVKGIDATAIEVFKHYEISIKYDPSTEMYYGLIEDWNVDASELPLTGNALKLGGVVWNSGSPTFSGDAVVLEIGTNYDPSDLSDFKLYDENGFEIDSVYDIGVDGIYLTVRAGTSPGYIFDINSANSPTQYVYATEPL